MVSMIETANASVFVPELVFRTRLSTDNAMGNIIIVVAVLLIHMLMQKVDNIKPRMILFPLLPVNRRMFNAIR